ncbi:MAG: hypothetical protein DCC69_10110 [Hyphomicrobiales bacterium]|nr:MAG: hypothetical protein DCC69_10110 [Hyphomicrobiales bacterium]
MSRDEASGRLDRIRDLNDRLRVDLLDGEWVLTAGIAGLDNALALKVIHAVRTFDAFPSDDGSRDEHDFGAMQVDGVRVCWKIDCYDLDKRQASSDPADETRTLRVLTVMLAEEFGGPAGRN